MPHKPHSMIIDILRDPYSYVAAAGVGLMSSIEYVVNHVNPVLGLLAGIGGLWMLSLSIIEKIKRNRLLDAEYEEWQEEKRRRDGES